MLCFVGLSRTLIRASLVDIFKVAGFTVDDFGALGAVSGNAVGIVSLKKDELLGLIVEGTTLAKTMKAIFDLAWLGTTAFVAR